MVVQFYICLRTGVPLEWHQNTRQQKVLAGVCLRRAIDIAVLLKPTALHVRECCLGRQPLELAAVFELLGALLLARPLVSSVKDVSTAGSALYIHTQ